MIGPQLLCRLYNEAWDALDGNPIRIALVFESLAAVARKKIPRKRKGPHDPDFDHALLAAYDAAPKGQRTVSTARVGATHRRDAAATERHLRRLLAERKRREEAKEKNDAVIARVDQAMQRGDKQAALNLTIDCIEGLLGYPLPPRFREGPDAGFEEVQKILGFE